MFSWIPDLPLRRRRSEDGQAAVETAVVLPLYLFLILGTIQLSLMHQARLMVKYAAYRAVRIGAIHNADVSLMKREALAVMMPMIGTNNGSGADVIRPVNGAARYLTKAEEPQILANLMSDAKLPYVDVTICGPTTSEVKSKTGEVDFDDPQNSTEGDTGGPLSQQWEASERTKLRIQVTYNDRLVIPFADWVIVMAARNQEIPELMRLGKPDSTTVIPPDVYLRLAQKKHVYVLPIRATYTMRMQSNLYLNNLPSQNECVFPWN